MKKQFYTIAALLLITTAANAQVGIGTTTPDTSSMLDIKSATKGFLMPRMTSAERGAIATPAKGLQVFDITTNSPWYFNGTAWVSGSSSISDLRLLGTRNHITQDAGKNSNGTDGGGSGASGDNIAIGASALGNIGVGVNNIAIGTNSLSTNVAGENNIAVGLAALSVNTASYNTAIGIVALQNNAGGAENTAVGYSTLTANTSGNSNVAVGSQSLRNNTGSSNVAVGAVALNGNTNGVNNTAVGTSALQVANANYNTAIGLDALRNTTTGGSNTALGFSAGSGITTGTANIAIGQAAQVNDPAGAYQLSIGNVIYGNNMGNTTAGNIGIGTATPFSQAKLHVAASNGGYGEFAQLMVTGSNINQKLLLGYNTTNDNAYIQSVHSGSNWKDLLLQPSGANVGIGMQSAPVSLLQVNGVITATKIQGPSDSRFKKNIKPIENALQKVMKLGGYTYDWKDASEFPTQSLGKGHDMGVIAQEVEKQFPEAVSTNVDGFKAVSYTELVPALIEAIKAQQVLIEDLQAKVAKLTK